MKNENKETIKTCHPELASGPCKGKMLKGFTLAEVLITLSILGIVAAITIPVVIGKQIESQNRAKVRKAMAAYERAVNQILVDNDLQTQDSFKNWADNDAAANNYAKQRSYFKIAEESTSYPNCRFKTGDGVWWDICGENKSNIGNPILILDKSYKDTPRTGDDGLEALAKTENGANGKKAYVFAMVGHRDTTTGSVRVNDKAYEDGIENNTANQQYLEKTFAFNEKRTMSTANSSENQSYFATNCTLSQDGKTCTINGKIFNVTSFDEEYSYNGAYCSIYDSNSCEMLKTNSKSKKDTYYTVNIGGDISWDNADSECKKIDSNLRVANIAELQKLNSQNVLKCKDGSMDCNFWAKEATTDGDGVCYYAAADNVISDFTSYSWSGQQVVCVSN